MGPMTESSSWNVLPRPSDEGQSPDGIGFLRIDDTTVACELCGALVAARLTGRHRAWHGEAQAGPAPIRVRPVHGMRPPTDPSHPSLTFDLVTSYQPADARRLLRDWVAEQKSDLGFDEPTGFRATLLPRLGFGAWTLPVRFACDVTADRAGTRVTVLLVAAMDQFGDADVRNGSFPYQERFAGIRADITELLGRR